MKQIIVLLTFCVTLICSNAQTTKPEWRSVASLPLQLTGHRSVALHTGEVLVCGGITNGGAVTTSSYIFANGIWRQTSNQLNQQRAYHALVSVRQANGESLVFAIGGYAGSSGNYSSIPSVEVLRYTPATKTWSWRNIGNLPMAVGSCAAAFNKNGYVIVSGGRLQNSGALFSGIQTAVTARINVATLAIEKIGDMSTPRSEHTCTMLVSATNDSTVVSTCGENVPIPSTEILTNITWDARANPPVFQQRFASGFTDRALIARMIGGIDETAKPTNRGEWYDVKSGWRLMPRMQTARAKFSIVQIAGLRDTTSNYLVVGGESTSSTTAECEMFSLPDNANPNGAWSPFNTLTVAGAERTIAIDTFNLPVVVGGTSNNTQSSSTEVFQPFLANDQNFGQQEIGGETQRQLIKVQNTWLLPVMLRNIRVQSAEFRITNALDSIVVSSNGTFTIDVRFRPNAIGQRSAVLLFDVGSLTDTIRLEGVGIKSSITVLSSAKDFATHKVKTDTTICFYAIRNDGKDTTVVDSVDIVPKGAFVIISPVGSVRIPPNDSLLVCVKFTPTARTLYNEGAIVHIADKQFPVSLTGRGIRAYITTQGVMPCDTIALPIGDSIAIPILINNPSDLPVQVTSTTVRTALQNTFVVRTITPLSIPAGSSQQVIVMFTAQRESEERATIEFINNGDTICSTVLCITPRNRTIKFNAPQIQGLTLCVGDSTMFDIILENPSAFDTLRVDSIQVTGMYGYPLQSSQFSLLPRRSLPVTFVFSPQSAANGRADIRAFTNLGSTAFSLNFNAQPSMIFSIDNATSSLSTRITIPIRRGDNITSTSTTKHVLQYNGSLLSPRALVNLNGKNYINTTTSTLQTMYGVTHCKVDWNSHPTSPDIVFGIECDVLRGDDTESTVTFSSDTNNSVCTNSTKAVFDLQKICGGRNGLISGVKAVTMQMMPNPTSNTLHIHVLSPTQAQLRISTVLGEEILQHNLQSTSQTIDVSTLPSGVYYCSVIVNGNTQLTQTLTIYR